MSIPALSLICINGPVPHADQQGMCTTSFFLSKVKFGTPKKLSCQGYAGLFMYLTPEVGSRLSLYQDTCGYSTALKAISWGCAQSSSSMASACLMHTGAWQLKAPGRYAVKENAWEVAFICTPACILAMESRSGCISLLPVPIVRGVLSLAPITPRKPCLCGNPSQINSSMIRQNEANSGLQCVHLDPPCFISTHEFNVSSLGLVASLINMILCHFKWICKDWIAT